MCNHCNSTLKKDATNHPKTNQSVFKPHDDIAKILINHEGANSIRNYLQNSTHNMISQAIRTEPVNYYKLISGNEIIYCVNGVEFGGYYLLWPMQQTYQYDNAITSECRKDYEKNKGLKECKFAHFAFVEVRHIPIKKSVDVWRELSKKHFSCYVPEEGPIKHGGAVGIFRVFRTNVGLKDIILNGTRTPVGIKDECIPLLNDNDIVSQATEVLTDESYIYNKNEILSILDR